MPIIIKKPDKADLFIYGFFLGLALVFFYPFLTGKNVLAFRDLCLYFYPLRYLMVSLVREGQLPLWNPYLFCGHPLLATLQVGFLYPLSIIHYLLPFNLAFNYYTIIHYFLAALFMYWLARYFSLSRGPAVLAGLVFAFSGYLLSMANMNTTLSSVIWLPLILAAYDRLVERFAWKTWVVLGLLFAVQFLGGEPTVLYLSFIFLLFYGLVMAKPGRRIVASIVLAAACHFAAGLTAVQLLPFLEALGHSLRFDRISFEFISAYSFPPRELINFFLPFFFGELVRTGTYTKVLSKELHQVWLLSPYLGALPLLLAMLTWLYRTKKVIFFWAAAALSILLAFGRFSPVYHMCFYFLPGFALIRYPVKFMFIAVFCFSFLAGLGLQYLLEVAEQEPARLKSLLISLGGLAFTAGSVYFLAGRNIAAIYQWCRSFFPADLSLYHQGILWKIITADIAFLPQLTAMFLLVFGLLYLSWKNRLRPGSLAVAIISIVTLDLIAANILINPPADHRVYDRSTPNIDIIKKDKGLYRYFAIPPRGNENNIVFEVFNENLFHIKDNLTPNMLLPDRLACFGGRASVEPKGFTDLTWEYIRLNQGDYCDLLDLANVKYIFALKDLQDPALKILRIKPFADIKGYLYQNRNCLPRAFFIRSLEDVRPAASLTGREKVRAVELKANRVVLETFADRRRWLFLSDTYYPGWRAYVDGKAAPIHRAKQMFRAVELPAGRHQVVFSYEPMSLRLGALISLLCFIAAGSLWFRART
ncbi:MAG: YfhO family protein [Candidatus Saganbacteria bacterium]|nr:YfhO family protein [Candidatus Saganbacteria bacterium]